MSMCQRIVVDGEPVLLRVTEPLDNDEIEAFSEIIRAARRKYGHRPSTTNPKENTMHQVQVHVTPRKDSDVWDVQVTPLSFETQEDAIRWGRAASKALDGEFYVHGEDGQIREKDSHGHDPKEIRG